jgi:filamentous hemagglutinin family protein
MLAAYARALLLDTALSSGRQATAGLSSQTRGHRRLVVGLAATLAIASPALAQTVPGGLPSGGVFVAGSGTIESSAPRSLQINQSSDRGVIDWRAFSIAADHLVNIDNGSGATLNRVRGGDISRIDGLLSATGSVYLMNPHGVIVGPGGRVLTGGNFVASTRQIDADAFMAGGALRATGGSDGAIVNNGSIVSQSGSVVMIARAATNNGTIQAAKGRVSMAAADDVLLATTDGKADNIFVAYSAGGGGDITQQGRIEAAAVALHAAGGNIFALAGNRDGLVQATGTATINGELWLTAPKGTVTLEAAIDAVNADGSGGTIVANGGTVHVGAAAQISAAGSRGGEVLLGASQFGTGTGLAESLTIESGARITAGGPHGGGRIETSAHAVDIGTARIDAGRGGKWLLDPSDITIDAVLAGTIVSSLDGGSDFEVETASGTGGAGDITVASPIVWTGSGGLTLNADRNIAVNEQIAGGGNVNLLAQGDIAIGAAVSGAQMFAQAPGTVTIAAAGSFTGTGNVGIESATFVNQAGAGAVSSSGGDWLIVSDDAAGSADGGLLPDYYAYDYANVTAVPAPGNGRFYREAPSVSFTLGPVVKDYDGTTVAALDDSNVTVTGLINGDAFTLDGVYADKNAGTGIAVTADNFEANRGGIAVYGYDVPVPSVTDAVGTINRATLTAAIVGNPTKTYNATTAVSLTSANFQLTGVVAGETITVNGAATAAYDSADAGSRTVDATLETPNFTFGSGALLANYVLPTSATGAGMINPAAILISGVTANDKVYDSTTAATLNIGSATIFGVVAGDTVSLDGAGATGVFASEDVGDAIAVTGTGFALSGADAANYVVTQPTGLAANITRATLEVTGLTANDKVYDGTRFASVNTAGLVIDGLIAGDDITPVADSGAQIAFATKDVGNDISVTVSGISLSGSDAGNYNLNFSSSLVADITPRPLTIGGSTMPTKIYDGTTDAFVGQSQVVIGNVVAGESITITQASGLDYASKNVGIWDIDVALTTSDYQAGANTLLSNYILPTAGTIQGEITPAPLTITIVGNPTKTYDGNANASLGPSNFQVDGFVAGEGATITETSGQYASSSAGVWSVSADLDAGDFDTDPGTMMSNYIIPTPVTGFGTIVRRDLGPGVIYIDITGNPTKIYDGTLVATLSPSDYTLGGFLPGEGAIITETVGEYSNANVGQWAVTVQLDASDYSPFPNTDLANYNLPTEATGLGTILKAPLGLSIVGNPTRVYNGTTRIGLTPLNFQFSGLISGESIFVSPGNIGAFDSKNAGSRTVTASFPSMADFVAGPNTLLTNYLLPTSATGPGTIAPAPLNILNVGAANKMYDQTTVATLTGSATLFGAVSGDDVVLSSAGSTGTFATANVGNGIAVTVAGFTISGADTPNYTLFQPSGITANITARPLTIANLTADDKVYDGTTAATLSGSATLVGVLGGDTVLLNGLGSTASFLQSNVGTDLRVNVGGYALAGAQSGNYSLSQPSGLTADITARPLTGAIIGNPTKIYDGTTGVSLTSSNYSLTGFIAGEGGSITQSAGAAYDSANAGARTVTATVVVSDFVANPGTLLSNYALPTSISGAGTITQAQLLAAIVGNPTKVYDATTTATLTSANYALSGFVSGESATVTQTAGTYDQKNVGSRTVTASLAGGDFSAGAGTTLANYVLPTSATGAGTITQAQVQVIGVTAQDKIYDGTTAAGLLNGGAGLSGVLGSDTVNVVTSGASGTFATKNVGTDIPVTATGYTIAGADAANYSLLQPTGLAADITQLAISLASVTKVYDADTPVPTVNSAYTLAGVVAGDAVGVDASGITGDYIDKNVGSNKSVTLTGVLLNGADAGNYSIAPGVTNATIGFITPATLNITGVAALDKVYDQSSTATLDNSATALSGVLTGPLGTDDVSLVLPLPTTGNFVDGSGNPTANAGTWSVLATGYTVSGGDAANYTLVQPQGVTATITRRPITLTSVVKIYDGSVALPTASSAYGFTGILSGDVVTADASAATGDYADKNVGGSISGGVVTGGINVDVAGLVLGGTHGLNYSVADVTNSPIGVINPKQLTASIIGNPTKTYDALTGAILTSANYQIDGFVPGESATVTETAGSYDSINSGARTVTATLDAPDFVAGSGTLFSNYLLPTSASGPGQINQAVLTISGVVANSKPYDGTTAATLDSAAAVLNGIVPAEPLTITLNISGATGQFAQANVGTNIPVTATGYTLDGDINNNYILTQPTGLFADITQALLTLAEVTRVYNGLLTLPADSSAYRLTGVVAGDDVFVSTGGISGAYASKDVATGINVDIAGLALGGADASNYSIVASLDDAPIGTITRATLTAAIIGDPTKIYDGNTAATLTGANFQFTGFVLSEGATVSQTAGTYNSPDVLTANSVTASLTGFITAGAGTDLNNYILPTSATGVGSIDPKSLTALIVGDPTKVYDGNAAATLAAANYNLVGLVGSESITVGQTAGLYASPNAGSRAVTASLGSGDFTAGAGTTLSNYVLPTTATGLGTINQRALTAAIIGNPTKTYDGNTGATLTSANYALTGFVSGEGATVTETAGSYDLADAGSRTVTATLAGGDFMATGSTDLANYVLPTTATGAGTITAKALTALIIGNPTKPYDGTTAATLASINYLLTGFVGSDSVTVTQTVGAYASPNAGIRLITAQLASGDFTAGGSTNLANYILPTSASGNGTITRLALSASIIGNPTRTYDGTTVAALTSGNYALTGFISGEGATVTETIGSYDQKNAGSRTVTATLDSSDFTATGGTLLDNYVFPASATGAGTITQKVLTAAITGLPTKVYDATAAATLASSNFLLEGFVAGEGATVTETVGSYASANAGIRRVDTTLDGGDFTADAGTSLANYVLPTAATGFGIITRAQLTAAIIGNPTRTYDATTGATLTSANYQLTGFVGGQGATVTETMGQYDSPNAGARTVTASLGSADFTADAGTMLSNYVLPTTASGAGTITQALLSAAIVGNPTKTYDGTTAATLTGANYQLTGFVAGEGASVTQTAGSYASPNAGLRIVTAILGAGDFQANGGTLLSNYVLPTSASGTGTIGQAVLIASIIGNPTKVYDATVGATLGSANYQLSGFVSGEGATITETQGSYGSANAGIRTVTALLDTGDFAADAGTSLSNYVLPTSASGLGTITQAALTAAIVGNPTKVYDGSTGATLTGANFQLSGFVAGEGATVTETTGSYGSANAGPRIVSATLDDGDFTADAGTLLSNYILPASASGAGTITQATLSAAITGNPTKTYDGTTVATLTGANFALTGFVAGEGATVTETAGSYGSPNAGIRAVTAALDAGDFTADAGTLLANYVLPTSATGLGTITRAALVAAIVGKPTKTYDATTDAALTSANYVLTGFVAGEGASVTQTAGTYGSPNAGIRTVTAALGSGDFAADAGTLLDNYVLPASATGLGTIDPKEITLIVAAFPDKVYDGTLDATLDSSSFRLDGFVGSDGVAIESTVTGTYADSNVGLHTISITPADTLFVPLPGTDLGNYVLRSGVNGVGRIVPAPLTATLVDVFKTYDGSTAALLGPGNFVLNGFVAGQGASVIETAGVFASANAGERAISAALDAGDFVAASGTLLTNYQLPLIAEGVGRIDRAQLSAAIIGNPTKVYDATTAAALNPGNFALSGFVAGEGATVTETAGSYDSANAGARIVTATLDAGDFAGTGATLLANYILPISATGAGTIDPRALTAVIVGNPTKVYDGSVAATLAAFNFALNGFVAGEGATVTQTAGSYDDRNAGVRTVSAGLTAGNFMANAGTLLSNYVLPTSATGPGTIDRRTLTAAITGYPTKIYDGTTDATLVAGDYTLSGFVAGESATVTETHGNYATEYVGVQQVSAALDAGDFAAGAGTLLSNYVLPTVATGEGEILIDPDNPDCVIDFRGGCLPDAPEIFVRWGRTVGNPHFYIPYPTIDPIYLGRTNAFGGLPSIIAPRTVLAADASVIVQSGAPTINSTEQILQQGGRDKQWQVISTLPVGVEFLEEAE